MSWSSGNNLKRQRVIEDDSMSSSDSLNYHNMLTNDTNCHHSDNVITFCDTINWNSVYKLNKMLKDTEAEIIAEKKSVILPSTLKKCTVTVTPKPIILHLTTYGGSVHAAMSVVDTIQSLEIPVYTVINGYVASAGTLISMAGAKRFIGKNAYILIHELRCNIWGKFNEIENQKDNASKLMHHIITFYLEQKIKMTREELSEFLQKDIDLCAEEAIKKGLADSYYTQTSIQD
jgi:ATP-dependent protease ClpP protease subunit